MSLTNKLGNMHLAGLYNTDLWPGVTNLIISEMVKRTWLLFKIHLSNIALDSGLSANLDGTIQIGQPAEFDDEVFSFGFTNADISTLDLKLSRQLNLPIEQVPIRSVS
jgi:hypothetical protein